MLKLSRVAWYSDAFARTAYYEQPTPHAEGVVIVNGKRITGLVVDFQGLYADVPSPKVQQMIQVRGISLDGGWSCLVENRGLEINEAIHQSPYSAARHYEGHISIQNIDQTKAVVLVDGRSMWTVEVSIGRLVLAEMGVSTQFGWSPVYRNLLESGEQIAKAAQILLDQKRPGV